MTLAMEGRTAIVCAWGEVSASQTALVSVTRMWAGVVTFARSPDVLVWRKIVPVMVNVTQHFISARVTKAGLGTGVISQTALVLQIVSTEDTVMVLWKLQFVKTARGGTWDRLVTTPVHMVCRYQWTAVTAYVSMVTLALVVTVSVLVMEMW